MRRCIHILHKETWWNSLFRDPAGAGLESPIVFLVGLREHFEEEQSLRLSDEEREEIIRDNTPKIYMAATRAGQRLVFTYVGDLPSALKEIFKP